MALDIPLASQKPKAATYVYTYADVCQAAKRGNLPLLKLALFGEGFNLDAHDKVWANKHHLPLFPLFLTYVLFFSGE